MTASKSASRQEKYTEFSGPGAKDLGISPVSLGLFLSLLKHIQELINQFGTVYRRHMT
jgi:hypothetical protein